MTSKRADGTAALLVGGGELPRHPSFGDDVKQLLQATPSECRIKGPLTGANSLLTEVDIDTLASTKDEGDLPADAVVKVRRYCR